MTSETLLPAALDVKKVSELVSNALVVGVGESSHGTHEFFSFKKDLAIELVETHGFNTFLMEDSQAACEKINDFIATGDGDVEKLIENLYPVWQTGEFVELVLALRKTYNTTPLSFYGFDIEQTKATLPIRDQLMAKQVIEYVSSNPAIKAFAWAHNAHVKRASKVPAIPMGHYLNKHFGNKYLAIGLFFGSGNFSSTIIAEEHPDWTNRKLDTITVDDIPKEFLEHQLDTLGAKPYYFSISDFTSPYLADSFWARSFGWGLKLSQLNQQAERIIPDKDFDMIVYYPKSTITKPLQ